MQRENTFRNLSVCCSEISPAIVGFFYRKSTLKCDYYSDYYSLESDRSNNFHAKCQNRSEFLRKISLANSSECDPRFQTLLKFLNKGAWGVFDTVQLFFRNFRKMSHFGYFGTFGY